VATIKGAGPAHCPFARAAEVLTCEKNSLEERPMNSSRLALAAAAFGAAVSLSMAPAALAQKRPANLEALPSVPTDYTPPKTPWGDWDFSHSYKTDFATSCNNAFSSFWDHSGMTADLLSSTAKTYFGLNQEWDIGLGQTAAYMDVPASLHRGELAESLVGQGNVVSCPLAMCSVAATVANGTFKQPILLPGQQQVTATPLGSGLQSNLKTLMSSVISSGTAASVGFPKNGHFFAKTGTAEVGSGAGLYNNSWFVVFDDQHDIALCALSIKGGYGAAVAAPECLKVFQKLGYA